MRKRNKAYKPRLIRLPMTPGLSEQIALHMHASLASLRFAGDVDSFDSLAGIINMVGIAIEADPRFEREFRLVTGGAMAMNQISTLVESGLKLKDHHIAPIQVAVNVIDEILGRIDVSRLFVSEKIAVAASRQLRTTKKEANETPRT